MAVIMRAEVDDDDLEVGLADDSECIEIKHNSESVYVTLDEIDDLIAALRKLKDIALDRGWS